ncbi:5-formyltetrahydrofolate cyclo-ligase [Bailinhaonella thermotolerans]|uniref:5-formyltetrahydrofolate cyclo-ligase n=1 Tax=Bailinhaonella thermotolerans TaxID=1070861 RepID=A0A3A4B6X5_9ACTN|nr:5-formyltetrahydrofolate cyclo-ligase [Bailinhaonella thermotolerans]RJL33254.1 5-formyltetrahydrofolate cyclo-ligase [Bailinhaonella thermotolerans]
MDKPELRRRVLTARLELSDPERREAARGIREGLLADPRVTMAGTVACYWSMGSEPATQGLVYALWKHGATVILPVLRPDSDLDWAAYEGPDSLRPGPRGLMEPTDARLGVDAVRRAALVLVPALAVSRATGVRLGRGGGSYDRVLARLGPNAPSIALLYDGELLDEVPAEPHDRPVSMVATPGGLVTL